mmetsp:Transcript_65355/g.156252  ORF Transcript_65355/g.156252 Transcript_65355/m.156252 type:complete len:271 (-) Transcript_65355:151-963(-)
MVDLLELDFGLKAVSSAGNVLNPDELLGLQAGMTVLQSQERHDSIFFWGKMFGENLDYYIAYGLRDSEFEFPCKVFYFASHDYQFKPLGRLTEEIADRVLELGIETPFTGNPDCALQAPDEQDQGTKLLEIHRLSQVVQEIDFDTAVVPAGAYALSEASQVVPSSDFKGLGSSKAMSLEKYVHFRPPTSVQALKAIARSDVQFYSNFLDPLERDLPKGCWVIRQDKAGSLVNLRSMCWPGYLAYHAPNTKKFGGLYFGYGQRRRDLPFIL